VKGKIIDKNLTDAFVVLENGDTMDVRLSNLPKTVQVGDSVDVPFNSNSNLTNDKLVDFF
jgi:hypothetical protein